MSFIKKLSELSAAKAAVAQQEKQLNDERTQALSSLHVQFGYPDLKSFIKALKTAPRPKNGKSVAKVKAKAGNGAKRQRLTAEARQALVEAARAGKTGAELVKEFGVSIATVHNLKKAAGLVKARG